MTIVLCWLDIRLWYEMDWLLSNGLVRTFEISFAFCQTNAFIQLCYKLSFTMQETNFDESERNKRNKLFNIVLICGLIVFNAVFVFYIIYTMVNTRGIEQDAEIGKPQFINLEICCWIVGMVSSAILISSIVYTIIKLNAMFPGQDI
jgi:heme/copper-type cytochrome/quinol oxidase subunit 2